jgi:plastocyanin
MKKSMGRVGLLFLVAAIAAEVAHAGPVSGSVRTVTRPGVAPAGSIVYAEPIDQAAARRPGTFVMTQRDKTFQPHVLPVPLGSTVEFPNKDAIFHNVFSIAGPQPFDLGLYRAGASKRRTFTDPGTYRVFCNIHPQMTAIIVVVPTPYVTSAGPDGRFVLDLPPGRYRLTALSERAGPVSSEVISTAGAVAATPLTLDESAWVAVQHKNKFGQDYPPEAYKK